MLSLYQKNQILTLYKTGSTYKNIVSVTGISYPTVAKLIKNSRVFQIQQYTAKPRKYKYPPKTDCISFKQGDKKDSCDALEKLYCSIECGCKFYKTTFETDDKKAVC